jgi:hypothetical protein
VLEDFCFSGWTFSQTELSISDERTHPAPRPAYYGLRKGNLAAAG